MGGAIMLFHKRTFFYKRIFLTAQTYKHMRLITRVYGTEIFCPCCIVTVTLQYVTHTTFFRYQCCSYNYASTIIYYIMYLI